MIGAPQGSAVTRQVGCSINPTLSKVKSLSLNTEAFSLCRLCGGVSIFLPVEVLVQFEPPSGTGYPAGLLWSDGHLKQKHPEFRPGLLPHREELIHEQECPTDRASNIGHTEPRPVPPFLKLLHLVLQLIDTPVVL